MILCVHQKDKQIIIPGEAAINSKVDGKGQNDTKGRNEDHYIGHVIVKEIMETEKTLNNFQLIL